MPWKFVHLDNLVLLHLELRTGGIGRTFVRRHFALARWSVFAIFHCTPYFKPMGRSDPKPGRSSDRHGLVSRHPLAKV